MGRAQPGHLAANLLRPRPRRRGRRRRPDRIPAAPRRAILPRPICRGSWPTVLALMRSRLDAMPPGVVAVIAGAEQSPRARPPLGPDRAVPRPAGDRRGGGDRLRRRACRRQCRRADRGLGQIYRRRHGRRDRAAPRAPRPAHDRRRGARQNRTGERDHRRRRRHHRALRLDADAARRRDRRAGFCPSSWWRSSASR